VAGRVRAVSALERAGFPVGTSRLAEYESWRKELHRPGTYVHKWWARRLGSVFRQMLLSAVDAPDDESAATALDGLIIYEPFAGSGTTVVEALKLGARVIARDINPVATLTQRQAVQPWDVERLEKQFAEVANDCRDDIDALFVTSVGEPVLHYFWVAVARCGVCDEEVELFSTYLFAKHAYPKRHPRAHATCPTCHAVCPVMLDHDENPRCSVCDADFGLTGPVRGRTMICSSGHRSEIIKSLGKAPPVRRMYAKAVKSAEGREYHTIDSFDIELYERAARLLEQAAPDSLVLPQGKLESGTNTIQALRWGYQTWASFFNKRQLYCLGRIASAIRDLPGYGPEREALAAAFGKTLEHHNQFCSYKGEGTGPVRSIFHNHVLRPERCSVEGNPWGAEGGSGGYAEAWGRLMLAQNYKETPTDLTEDSGKIQRVAGRSSSLQGRVVTNWKAFESDSCSVYLSTGDAASTDLPDGSVSLICTDPPYVDNVHYSELADFFHAWMCQIRPYREYTQRRSTRDPREVQNSSPNSFAEMISGVWKECDRVLTPGGLLMFSFHQSRTEGWAALMEALHAAGFSVTATHPVVAEVTTSLTKSAAIAPNRIDVTVVCRRRSEVRSVQRAVSLASSATMQDLEALRNAGLTLGKSDVLSAVRAAVLATGTQQECPDWQELIQAAETQAHLAVAAWASLIAPS
jgi:putative DNA methylase